MSDFSVEDMTAIMAHNAANMELAEKEFVTVLRLHPDDLREVGCAPDEFSREEFEEIAGRLGEFLMENYWDALREAVQIARDDKRG